MDGGRRGGGEEEKDGGRREDEGMEGKRARRVCFPLGASGGSAPINHPTGGEPASDGLSPPAPPPPRALTCMSFPLHSLHPSSSSSLSLSLHGWTLLSAAAPPASSLSSRLSSPLCHLLLCPSRPVPPPFFTSHSTSPTQFPPLFLLLSSHSVFSSSLCSSSPGTCL